MSRRLPLLLALALLHTLAPGLLRGQTFYFADGRKASLPPARIQVPNIIVPLKLSAAAGGGSAELSLPISTLVRLDWPAPPALAAAETDLAAGHPADALKKIDALLPAQKPFRSIPGSWWTQAAITQAVALATLGKTAETDTLLADLRLLKAPPEALSRIEVATIGHLIATGKTDDANARLEQLQNTATDDDGLASIALIKGRILAAAGQPEAALLSFLRVPVLYPSAEDQLPAALLGAAQAYKKLGDTDRAAATFTTLTTRFPNSPEAAQASNQ